MKIWLVVIASISFSCTAAEYQLAERTYLNGFVFKKGTRLITTQDGHAINGTLETDVFNNGLTWAKDIEVAFSLGSNNITYGQLTPVIQNYKVQDVPVTLKAGSSVTMNSFNFSFLKVFTTSADQTVTFKDGGNQNQISANTEVTLNNDLSIGAANLKSPFIAKGYQFDSGAASFYPCNLAMGLGPVRIGKLSIDGIIYGTIISAGSLVNFNELGSVTSINLSKDTKFQDVKIPAQSTAYFDGFSIIRVWLGSDLIYKGKTYAGAQFVPFNGAGEPYVPVIK